MKELITSILSINLIIYIFPLRAADKPVVLTRGESDFFESKIRPVLVKHCYECHSADSQKIKGGLRVDFREGLLTGGDSGPAIVPGKVEESVLLDAIRHEGLEMPPSGKLPEKVIQDFEMWVEMGAPDPRNGMPEGNFAQQKPRSIDIESGRKHWAYQPVREMSLPEVANKEWPIDPIDNFVLSKLEKAGIRQVGAADRYTWLRRVSLDLTGLPPNPAEISAFIDDSSAMAWQRVVDRLLASPAFGERWARHWLDMTGYADQVGTSNNVFAEHAWRYRDYLINSFNADKPFNRFVKEQLAGDLLPWKTPEERSDNLVATGFLVLGDVEIVNPDKLQLEADVADLQITKTGMVFLGQTLGCVRCHDHKFDPIGLEDYYGMAGIFRSTKSVEKIDNGIWSGITNSQLPETTIEKKNRQIAEADHQRHLENLKTRKAELTRRKESLASKNNPEGNKEANKNQEESLAREIREIDRRIRHDQFFRPAQPRAFAVSDVTKPSHTKINVRGNAYASGAEVPRGVLRVASWAPLPAIPQGQSGRIQLAEWLVDQKNPLTARVTVNRIWQKLFGEGIVKSVDYFGTRGDLPSHPELLDHLALRFMQGGWSQKRLIRSIVLSRTYRLSGSQSDTAARIDPENRLIWRMNRQRLDAEALRDSMLAVSGELKVLRGGPGMPLEYPENSSSLEPKAVNPPAFSLVKFRPEQEFQRTVYLPVIRSAQPELARLRDLFDFTQPAQIAGRRPQTVVPTQALFLLNNSLPRKRAAAMASAMVSMNQPNEYRMRQLWLQVFNRPVTEPELRDAIEFLAEVDTPAKPSAFQSPDSPVKRNTQSDSDRQVAAWTELCHALLCTNEFIFRQ